MIAWFSGWPMAGYSYTQRPQAMEYPFPCAYCEHGTTLAFMLSFEFPPSGFVVQMHSSLWVFPFPSELSLLHFLLAQCLCNQDHASSCRKAFSRRLLFAFIVKTLSLAFPFHSTSSWLLPTVKQHVDTVSSTLVGKQWPPCCCSLWGNEINPRSESHKPMTIQMAPLNMVVHKIKQIDVNLRTNCVGKRIIRGERDMEKNSRQEW